MQDRVRVGMEVLLLLGTLVGGVQQGSRPECAPPQEQSKPAVRVREGFLKRRDAMGPNMMVQCVCNFHARVVVELGTRFGEKPSAILGNCNEVEEMHSVDMFTPGYDVDVTSDTFLQIAKAAEVSREEFPKLMAEAVHTDIAVTQNRGCRFRLHHMSTVKAAELFGNESVDFLYVDALHTYEGVRADLRAWQPKLKRGAVIMFNDYIPRTKRHRISSMAAKNVGNVFPGVHRAADEWVVEQNLPRIQSMNDFDAWTRLLQPHESSPVWPCGVPHKRRKKFRGK
eukprot:Hpha_TRINITY_DN4054_c0_g1::TRINITY_DN4054_c0_g1_i1::g.63761::m.63761